MPTLARFLFSLVVIAGIIAAAVFALGNFVEPNVRQMTIRIPPGKIVPRPRAPDPTPAPAPAVVVDGADADGADEPAAQ
ncbi:MAG: hypothetical protein KDK07_25110 [Bauldia sp.]|nr:hypothetical protein [Bauldia sp.]